MEAHQLSIRPANLSDVSAIVELGARSFRDAYRGKTDPKELEYHIAEAFTIDKFSEKVRNPNHCFFLAYLGDQLVGFAELVSGSTTDCLGGESPIELSRIYFDGSEIGKGHGSVLMRFCLDEAKRLGGKTLWLGVWEENTRARRFYEKWGFKLCGTHEFFYAGKFVHDLVMVRDIWLDPPVDQLA